MVSGSIRVQSSEAHFMGNLDTEDVVISSGRNRTRVRWVLSHTARSDVTAHFTKPPFKKRARALEQHVKNSAREEASQGDCT
ncbi:hypothetical protein LXL04_012204 [Taraxacum kok-saghyz]